MSKTTTSLYDVAEHLRTPEEMAAYLEACLEEANGDAAFIAKALGDIARAKGMTQVARDAGLSRESLYKALSGERSPGFDHQPLQRSDGDGHHHFDGEALARLAGETELTLERRGGGSHHVEPDAAA